MIFIQVGLENSLYKKIKNKNLKEKKMIPIVISTISHFWSYPNNFLLVCICILIFHGI